MDFLEWPPQSPDLNLIEACWSDMEIELGPAYARCMTVEGLKEAMRDAWNNITPQRLEELIRGLRTKLQAVIDAGGAAIPY